MSVNCYQITPCHGVRSVVNVYYAFRIYPDMFRQLTAIFKGLLVPRKLLQYHLCLSWILVTVRSVWSAAVEYVLVCTDMFRQLTAIFRRLLVPRKLLQYHLCLSWI